MSSCRKLRQGVSLSITMKPNFSSFGIPENGFGGTFFRKKKREENFTVIRRERKWLLSRRNGKRQPANVENGGEIMVTWSLLPFAFQVNVILNLTNILVRLVSLPTPLSLSDTPQYLFSHTALKTFVT